LETQGQIVGVRGRLKQAKLLKPGAKESLQDDWKNPWEHTLTD